MTKITQLRTRTLLAVAMALALLPSASAAPPVKALQVRSRILDPIVVTVRPGVRELPANQWRAVPARITAIDLSLSRENWPAAGCEVGFLASYDGGQTAVIVNSVFIPAPSGPNPRTGEIDPAQLGFSWGEGVPAPTHVKLRTNNPSAAFDATAIIEVTSID